MAQESSLSSLLVKQIKELGFPEELGILISRQLHNERAQRRMLGYLRLAKPKRAEDLVDEMLAITEESRAWADKKAAEYYNAKYNAYLNSRPTENGASPDDSDEQPRI